MLSSALRLVPCVLVVALLAEVADAQLIRRVRRPHVEKEFYLGIAPTTSAAVQGVLTNENFLNTVGTIVNPGMAGFGSPMNQLGLQQNGLGNGGAGEAFQDPSGSTDKSIEITDYTPTVRISGKDGELEKAKSNFERVQSLCEKAGVTLPEESASESAEENDEAQQSLQDIPEPSYN
ncbi:MAG: hypothetical protein AAF266_04680 [Planctomycetota bacterium]